MALPGRHVETGASSMTKLATRVPVSELAPAPEGVELPTFTREVVRDLLPDLQGTAASFERGPRAWRSARTGRYGS